MDITFNDKKLAKLVTMSCAGTGKDNGHVIWISRTA